MNTKIELNYKGTDYTLEYNRQAVKVLEANGFKASEILEKPMTNIELMFQCAFLKNHPKTTAETMIEILDSCPDKTNLLVTLKTMIEETYDALVDVKDSGNVTWKVVDLSPKKTPEQSQK